MKSQPRTQTQPRTQMNVSRVLQQQPTTTMPHLLEQPLLAQLLSQSSYRQRGSQLQNRCPHR